MKRNLHPERYTEKDIAVIIPTKDRPGKLQSLLESLSAQTASCNRVILVDGGTGAADVAARFQDTLSIETFSCRPPGQLRQRKKALAQLDERTRLVCLLDDDMVLDPEAFESVLRLFNGSKEDIAGVGFNLSKEPPNRYSRLGGLFFWSGTQSGEVLKSGYNTPIADIGHDITTSWLGGGYTIWRQDILQQYPQEELQTNWAVGEDVRFSYAVSKSHTLCVCADARARHEHVLDQAPPQSIHVYRARKTALAKLYLVSQHEELSTAAWAWMTIGLCLLSMAAWMRGSNPNGNHAARGYFSALCTGVLCMLNISDPKESLKD